MAAGLVARTVEEDRSHAPDRTQHDLRHPVNRRYREEAPLGARIADRVTTFLGSWTFIAIQTVIVIVWIIGNVILLFDFDPFPFILLNLAFSTQAAYAAPLILLAGNRQSLRDRMTLEHAADEADIEEQQNRRAPRGQSPDPGADRAPGAADPGDGEDDPGSLRRAEALEGVTATRPGAQRRDRQSASRHAAGRRLSGAMTKPSESTRGSAGAWRSRAPSRSVPRSAPASSSPAILGAPSPLLAVARFIVDIQPPGAKEFVVALFGEDDKVAFEVFIILVALAVGAGLGRLAPTRPDVAAGVLAAFAGAGFAASLRDPNNVRGPQRRASRASRRVAGIWVLRRLVALADGTRDTRRAGRRLRRPSAARLAPPVPAPGRRRARDRLARRRARSAGSCSSASARPTCPSDLPQAPLPAALPPGADIATNDLTDGRPHPDRRPERRLLPDRHGVHPAIGRSGDVAAHA